MVHPAGQAPQGEGAPVGIVQECSLPRLREAQCMVGGVHNRYRIPSLRRCGGRQGCGGRESCGGGGGSSGTAVGGACAGSRQAVCCLESEVAGWARGQAHGPAWHHHRPSTRHRQCTNGRHSQAARFPRRRKQGGRQVAAQRTCGQVWVVGRHARIDDAHLDLPVGSGLLQGEGVQEWFRLCLRRCSSAALRQRGSGQGARPASQDATGKHSSARLAVVSINRSIAAARLHSSPLRRPHVPRPGALRWRAGATGRHTARHWSVRRLVPGGGPPPGLPQACCCRRRRRRCCCRCRLAAPGAAAPKCSLAQPTPPL